MASARSLPFAYSQRPNAFVAKVLCCYGGRDDLGRIVGVCSTRFEGGCGRLKGVVWYAGVVARTSSASLQYDTTHSNACTAARSCDAKLGHVPIKHPDCLTSLLDSRLPSGLAIPL